MKTRMVSLITIVVLILSFSSLSSCITTDDDRDMPSVEESVGDITMRVGSEQFDITLYDNVTAKAFGKKLPMTINMSDMPHEKYYNMPYGLPTNSQVIDRTNVGDFMLWGANCLVIFYETFSTNYAYTPIGKIKETSNLVKALGRGSVEIEFKIS